MLELHTEDTHTVLYCTVYRYMCCARYKSFFKLLYCAHTQPILLYIFCAGKCVSLDATWNLSNTNFGADFDVVEASYFIGRVQDCTVIQADLSLILFCE